MNLIRCSFLLCLLLALPAARAANFVIATSSGLFAPSGRGGTQANHYGWNTFGTPPYEGVLNDTTPDLGTDPGGARIATNNGQDHVVGSGNFYSTEGIVNETITVTAAGVLNTGFTTIIAQGVTAFGDFGSATRFGAINGVAAFSVMGINALGRGQFWVQWNLPGHSDSYSFTMETDVAALPAGQAGSFFSMDRLEVDTRWSSTGFLSDTVNAIPEPSTLLLLPLVSLLALRRGRSSLA